MLAGRATGPTPPHDTQSLASQLYLGPPPNWVELGLEQKPFSDSVPPLLLYNQPVGSA